ncbi:MAG: membrane protein [Methylohalobius crimeensis]
MHRWLPGVVLTLLFLAYPFLAQALVARGGGGALPWAIGGVLLWRAWRGKGAIRGLWLTLGLALLGGHLWLGAQAARWVPAVAFVWVGWVFGRTLMHPPPLIERMVRLQFRDIPPYLLVYLRRLTIVWTGFFLAAATLSVGLTLVGTQSAWLGFHGFGIYLAMAVLVSGEYLYRRWRFPELERVPPPQETFREVIKHGKRLWED